MNEKITLSDKVNELWSHYKRSNGKRYTYQDVSEGTGLAVSHIWKIRNGEVKQPSNDTLSKLLQFFGAPANFFDNVTYEDTSQDYERSLVMRSRHLDEKGRAILSTLLDGLVSEMGSDED